MDGKRVYLFAFVFLLISVSLVSAGLLDFLKLTGQASSNPTNVSVKFKDKHPCEISDISVIPNVDPLENTYTTVNFSVLVYNFDKDGDMNFSSVFANFTSQNGVVRGPVNCVNVQNLTKRDYNFTCSIDMWYWDLAGDWDIGVVCSDLGNLTPAYNITTNFTYNQLKAMVTYPYALTWPILETQTFNQTSDNDPSLVNNTGNYNGTIEVTGYELIGESDINETMGAGNFTTGLLTGSQEECVAPTSAVVLINDTAVTVTGAIPNPGNLSLNDGSGQEELYYCIPAVPNVTTQTYSTNFSQPWVIAYGV